MSWKNFQIHTKIKKELLNNKTPFDKKGDPLKGSQDLHRTYIDLLPQSRWRESFELDYIVDKPIGL